MKERPEKFEITLEGREGEACSKYEEMHNM
jgi:hypothetical protein